MLPQKQQDRKGMFTPYAWTTIHPPPTQNSREKTKREAGRREREPRGTRREES